jgi:hypothetical protein
MAIEMTETGRRVYVCDVCADEGIDRAWLRAPGLEGDPKKCPGPKKHTHWDYRAKAAKAEKESATAA